MATQQPIAHDLRALAASIDIRTEMERMGDYARGIAIVNIRPGGLSMLSILGDVYAMAENAMDMLHRALTTFAEENMNTAKSTIQHDGVIDECYTKLYFDAVNNVLGDPGNIERAKYAIWVADKLERLGDRITNICGRVIYTVIGELLEELVTTHELTRLK